MLKWLQRKTPTDESTDDEKPNTSATPQPLQHTSRHGPSSKAISAQYPAAILPADDAHVDNDTAHLPITTTPFDSAVSPYPDPGPPPDGGLTAWTQALMGFLTIFMTWGYLTSFGVFQSYYISTLAVSPASITWIGSLEIFLLFFVGAFSGRALDAGLFRPVFISGVVLTLLGTFMSSLASRYWQLVLAQGVCIGVGDGLMFTPAIGAVSTYFSRKRSMVLAGAACGGATGGMIFPAMARALLPQIGFGWTVRAMGFVQMGIAAVLVAFLKPRLPPRKGGPLVEWAAFREAPYTLFIIGMWFEWWAMYFAFYYISSYSRTQIHLPSSTSITVLILVNGLGIPGRFIPAILADLYLGPLNAMLLPSLLSSILMYAWPAVHTSSSLWAFAALDGIIPNGVQGLWPATLASLTDDVTKTGTRLGMGFTIVSFACLTGPPLGGVLIEKGGVEHGYLYAQVWAGTSFAVGTGFLVAARVAKSGWVWRYRV